MVLLLHGQGGTGKTEVVSLLRRLLRDVFHDGGELAVASSNSAARVIGGETIHSALKMSAQQPLGIDKLSNAKVDNDSIDRLSALEALIVEEVSMVPSALLGALSLRMCVARQKTKGCDKDLYTERGHMFGGVPIVMFLGDFYQLGPVRKGGARSSLLHRLPSSAPANARNGQRIFLDGVTHAMFLYETHRFKDRLVQPPRPCEFMPSFLQAMRNGDKLTPEQRKTVRGWVVKPKDPRLNDQDMKDGFEMAIGWEAVHRQMQYRCLREAREKKQMLLYVQAVDTFKHELSREEYMQMLQVVNINNAGHMLGMCPIYVGMRVRLQVKMSGKHRIVQDAAGEVVGVQFHPKEFEAGVSDWRSNPAHEALSLIHI